MAYKLVPRNVNMNELQNGRWACRSATKPLNYRDHRVSRIRSSKRFPSIPKDQLFFIPFRSSVYSEIDVLARLFKFSLSFSLFRPFSLDIPSLCPSYVTHVRYVIVRRPRPARHEWVTHADRPRVCVAACVRGRVRTLPGHVCDSRARAPIFRPSSRLRRLAYALFTPSD